MINEALIHSLVLHKVGNKHNEEGIQFSKTELNPDETVKALLTTYFISSFKSEEYYNLSHVSDINMNEVYNYVTAIFNNPDDLLQQSCNLASHLYEKSDHPKIKSGEFYVCYFQDCILDGEQVEAVGIFKSENKDIFLKIYPTSNNFIVESEEGINIKRLDKGCMIFNTEKENGYLVTLVDNLAKGGGEAQYWCEAFLNLRPHKNAYSQTQDMMKLCKEFVTERLPEHFEADKADQIDLLNRSMEYFKTNDTFDLVQFEEEVFQQPEIIQSFRSFDNEYREENDIPKETTFEIAPQAVKKQAKVFKSVLKLDKNFHVYIHGDRSLIEKGEEEGRKFYKIFYENES